MKVSIIMASCNPNREKLDAAVKSILNQTYKDYELIIVDDGSKESLKPMIVSISSDPRIKFFRIPNSGLGAALNFGIKHSSGQYIARLDDDDRMVANRLEKQVSYLDHHLDVSCVGTMHYDLYENKYYKHRHFPIKHDDIIKSLLNFRFALAHTTLMFRRDAFDKMGGYRIPRGGQDLDLELQMGTVGKLANIDEYLNFYTMSATGLGTVNPKKYEAYLFALQDVCNRNLFPQYQSIAKSSIEKLQAIDNSSLKYWREKFKRYLLILRVRLLGRKIV